MPRGQPMFTSELMLDTNALTYEPSEENFQVFKDLFLTHLTAFYSILQTTVCMC